MRTRQWTGLGAVVGILLLAGCSGSAPTGSPVPAGDSGGGKSPGGKSALVPVRSAAPTAQKAATTEPAKGDKDAAKPADNQEPTEAAESASLTTAELKSLAAGFQSPYSVQVYAATETFRKLPPDTRRNALAQLSEHDSASVRQNAWRVFATWASREDVPALIAALDSPHEDVHSAALELIARFPNEETISVLIKALENPEFRERAEALLVTVGPAAEGALLSYVSHEDAELRTAAWRVLGEIGSRKSLLALEQVATQGEFQKDGALSAELEKIRERLRR